MCDETDLFKEVKPHTREVTFDGMTGGDMGSGREVRSIRHYLNAKGDHLATVKFDNG